MTDFGAAVARIAAPVATGVVFAVVESVSVRGGPGQDVVHVRRIAAPVDLPAVLVQRRFLVQVVVVAVEVVDVRGNLDAVGIEPRSVTVAVPGIHRRLAAGGTGAEVGSPFTAVTGQAGAM